MKRFASLRNERPSAYSRLFSQPGYGRTDGPFQEVLAREAKRGFEQFRQRGITSKERTIG
jgi:hypothetical protein